MSTEEICEKSGLPPAWCGCKLHRPPAPPPLKHVLTLRSTANWWQLWAKTVTGVNLSEHCMKSLLGPKILGLGPHTPKLVTIVKDFPPAKRVMGLYLCGVSVGNDLTKNAHLFAVPDLGTTARLDWPGLQATISNARAVPIVPNWINGKHPHARDRVYATCRNWQAAWMMVNGADALQGGAVAPVHTENGLW